MNVKRKEFCRFGWNIKAASGIIECFFFFGGGSVPPIAAISPCGLNTPRPPPPPPLKGRGWQGRALPELKSPCGGKHRRFARSELALFSAVIFPQKNSPCRFDRFKRNYTSRLPLENLQTGRILKSGAEFAFMDSRIFPTGDDPDAFPNRKPEMPPCRQISLDARTFERQSVFVVNGILEIEQSTNVFTGLGEFVHRDAVRRGGFLGAVDDEAQHKPVRASGFPGQLRRMQNQPELRKHRLDQTFNAFDT